MADKGACDTSPRGYSYSGLRRRVARLNAGTLSRERFNAMKDRYRSMRKSPPGRGGGTG